MLTLMLTLMLLFMCILYILFSCLNILFPILLLNQTNETLVRLCYDLCMWFSQILCLKIVLKLIYIYYKAKSKWTQCWKKYHSDFRVYVPLLPNQELWTLKINSLITGQTFFFYFFYFTQLHSLSQMIPKKVAKKCPLHIHDFGFATGLMMMFTYFWQ